jgi:hypothetical protein
MPKMLTCSKCGIEKSLELFPKKGRCCKTCKAILDAAYTAKNKDKIQARKNEWQRNARAEARLLNPRAVSTLQKAKDAGHTLYNTGKPCPQGHIADRLVSNRACVECQRLRALAYKEQHREELLPKKRAYAKMRNEESHETVRAIAKRAYDSRTEEQRRKDSENAKKWRIKNKGRVLAWTRNRQLAKKQRTPAWLTASDKLKIEHLYLIAATLTRTSSESWHVDHIIPLQGENVSGLHVPSNLRVLRGKENARKRNKFEVTDV